MLVAPAKQIKKHQYITKLHFVHQASMRNQRIWLDEEYIILLDKTKYKNWSQILIKGKTNYLIKIYSNPQFTFTQKLQKRNHKTPNPKETKVTKQSSPPLLLSCHCWIFHNSGNLIINFYLFLFVCLNFPINYKFTVLNK